MLITFLNNDFRKKTNIINWNYIKNTTIYQSFIEIEWLIDSRKIRKLFWLTRKNCFGKLYAISIKLKCSNLKICSNFVKVNDADNLLLALNKNNNDNWSNHTLGNLINNVILN